jgi:hypothetical protein
MGGWNRPGASLVARRGTVLLALFPQFHFVNEPTARYRVSADPGASLHFRYRPSYHEFLNR